MWSRLTVLVKRPMWIFVGRGVGERFRRLRRSGDRDLPLDLLSFGGGELFLFESSFDVSLSFLSLSLGMLLLLLLVRVRLFGLVLSPLVVEEELDDELLDRELDPLDELLELCEDESLLLELSDELLLLSLLLEPESCFLFLSLPLSFFLSLSLSSLSGDGFIFALKNNPVNNSRPFYPNFLTFFNKNLTNNSNKSLINHYSINSIVFYMLFHTNFIIKREK